MNMWKRMLRALCLSATVCTLVPLSAQAADLSETYEIAAGDTFWKIAKKLDVSLQDLLTANPGVNPRKLMVGQTIVLPIPVEAAAVENTAPLHAPSVTDNQLVTSDGNVFSYSHVIEAKSTAYTVHPRNRGKARDYLGNPVKVGTIAVDPNIIPLGSKVYVTGYSFHSLPKDGMIAQATDIGGAIQGNKVDLFVPTADARDFGIQSVKVYILE